MTFSNVFLLYVFEHRLFLPLFYIICGYTAKQNFTPNILSNVSLCAMTFCYSRKLPSKVLSARG